MRTTATRRSFAVHAAAAAALWLVLAGLVLPFGVASLAGLTHLESSVPEYVLATLIMLAGGALGGGGFGHFMGRHAGGDARRSARAAALGFALPALIAAILLGTAEPVALRLAAAGHFKIHVMFTFMFASATLAVAGVLGLVLGRTLGGERLARRTAVRGGIAAASAFLVADVAQDLLGRRVGGPGAAATATMLTVAGVCLIVAAAAAGAAMARVIETRAATR